jgi:hypothetical protein
MIQRKAGRYPKLRVRKAKASEIAGVRAGNPRYVGNPMHKRFAEDYGLVPPSCARPSKTLCDLDPRGQSTKRSFPKSQAENLFNMGIDKGLFSEGMENGFPRRIWAVDEEGIVYEARLDDAVRGTYHGYPLSSYQRELIACITELWRS